MYEHFLINPEPVIAVSGGTTAGNDPGAGHTNLGELISGTRNICFENNVGK